MIYLSDNDIVEKLAIGNLLDDTLVAYAATRADVFVLPTLKYRIGGKSRAKAEKRLGEAAVARILEFLEGVQVIREYSPDDYQVLDDIVGIDPGEAVLLSATGGLTEFRLMTGDKRCIKTLCTCDKCKAIALRVRGRVACFEQVVCRLIDKFGFDYVLAKVVPVMFAYDTAIRAAFGSSMQSTEANTVSGLRSYVNELRGLPMDLLIADE